MEFNVIDPIPTKQTDKKRKKLKIKKGGSPKSPSKVEKQEDARSQELTTEEEEERKNIVISKKEQEKVVKTQKNIQFWFD